MIARIMFGLSVTITVAAALRYLLGRASLARHPRVDPTVRARARLVGAMMLLAVGLIVGGGVLATTPTLSAGLILAGTVVAIVGLLVRPRGSTGARRRG